jgi:hypothetical protein
LGNRPEHAHAVHAQVLLAWVVVDEPDRRIAQLAVALHLADQQLPRVTCAHDQHLLAARDQRAALRALDQRAREQSRARDEREEQQVVERRDAMRQPRRVRGRKRVEREVRERGGDGDAASRAPHVARRHVAPPAVVEAEDDEGRERDRDNLGNHLPVEVVPVVDQDALVEAEEERQPPRGRDQERVEDGAARSGAG